MTPPFFKTHPRACAVVLASSKGSRLFPMTTTDIPKHMLPVAGVPSIVRLLESLSAFSQIVIAVAEDDTKTLATLLGTNNNTDKTVATRVQGPSGEETQQSMTTTTPFWELTSELKRGQRIHVVKLTEDCYGSIDALRIIEGTKLIHPETRVVVFPGDLVILKKNTKFLDSLIRPASEEVACTAMLVDVLEQDEHGVPLKESAKAKKGGLSRDKEDIEYIALSFPQNRSSSSSWLNSCGSDRNKVSLPRIVLKKSKLDVEADEDMTGASAKLEIPKSRLRGREGGEQLVIRTEWSDVHVYSLAPWVRQLILARTKNFSSIQEDLVPLLISRQYRGKRATFGKSVLASLASKSGDEDEIMGGADNDGSSSDDPEITAATGAENIAPSKSGGSGESTASSASNNNTPSEDDANSANPPTKSNRLSKAAMDDEPYSVLAVVLPAKTTLRANTVPAYLFACKEAVANCGSDADADVRIPKDSKRNGKFQTLTLEGSTIGKKITMKSSTVGKSVTLGDKCRLNNVVIMDGVTIGEQCSLQNTIIGVGAKLGNNCSLNDCQVGPGVEIPAGTKEKGEPFVAGDYVLMESDADNIL